MMSSPQKLSFTFFWLCSSILLTVRVAVTADIRHHGQHRQAVKKLFVFGDSYVDTGNNRKSFGSSWKDPYGITFPGKPTGRFSDGRVFTDFLAKSLGLKSPVAYRWRKHSPKKLKYGMNFAFGGTGVFDTPAPYPNMTTQIDFFQQLVNENLFSAYDVKTSVALVSLAGNDYAAYLARGGSPQGLQTFITQVVNQLVLDIQRIHSLGVRKIAVTALEPLGCLPSRTVTNWFQQCNSTFNQGVSFHNLLLQEGLAKLNNQTHDHRPSPFMILDLYNAFLSAFKQKGAHSGSAAFSNPLKPCCMGVNQNYSCGNVDAKGNKMYTVCQDPKSAFFWDSVHPTQAGWHAVSLALQPSIQELHST